MYRHSKNTEKEPLIKDGSSTRNHRDSTSSSYGSIKGEPVQSSLPRCLCTKRDIVIVIISVLLIFIIITTSLILGLPKLEEKKYQYYNPPTFVSSSPLHHFEEATVISDALLCATIGKNVLKQGGSAVDAAIATLFCNGVVNAESMGLGGGFLMLIYVRETKNVEIIDARETAPAAATSDMFHGNATLSQEGGLAIAVPGELKGYWEAHKSFGKLSWSSLIEPSVNICRSGFPVSKHMADKLMTVSKSIQNNTNMRNAFINPETNELYKENEILKRPVLAKTLEMIASSPEEVIYGGELVKSLVQDISDCGGIITEQDFQDYKLRFPTPVQIQLQNPSLKTMYTVPVPGSGHIVSLILQILDGYNITSDTLESLDESVLMFHRLIESFKFGFAHRTKLGDESFVNISQLLSDLSSRKYADQIREAISSTKTHPPAYYGPILDNINDHGTSHVSVLAPNGDAVSVTSTINTYFGSRCLSPKTGIILNNEMDDFSSINVTNFFDVPPSPVNHIEPGKRPLSSMAPTILVNSKGDVELVTGAMGGTRIITATIQAIMRLLWLNEDVKTATDAQRIHHQLLPDYVYFEKDFPQVYRDRLKEYGHQFMPEHQSSEVLSIIKKENIQSNLDYRKSGSVDGF